MMGSTMETAMMGNGAPALLGKDPHGLGPFHKSYSEIVCEAVFL
jgi:hypothetical protein